MITGLLPQGWHDLLAQILAPLIDRRTGLTPEAFLAAHRAADEAPPIPERAMSRIVAVFQSPADRDV